MTLIQTKNATFTFGSEVPFKNVRVNKVYDKVEVTDNASDNIEYQVAHYSAELEVSGVIYKTTDKQIGKDLVFTFDSVPYKTTALSFEETFQEIPIDYGGIANSAKEYEVSKSERKFTAEIWCEDTADDPADGAEEAATLAFASGVSAAGNAVIESKNVEGEIKGNTKISLAGFLNGTVTETSIGLTAGTSATATLTLAEGTATDKEYTGTAILVSKKVSGSVDGDVNVSYTFRFSGALGENKKTNTA